MRIVAIETSTSIATVAAHRDGTLLVERASSVSNAHGESVFALLDGVLAEVGWTVQDVELWAAGVGPGSFTGTRVAISTVLGVRMATGAAAVGVTSFQSIRVGIEGPSIAVLPSLPGEYYLQVGEGEPCMALEAELSQLPLHGTLIGAWPSSFTQAIAATPSAGRVAEVASRGLGGALEPLYVAPPRLTQKRA